MRKPRAHQAWVVPDHVVVADPTLEVPEVEVPGSLLGCGVIRIFHRSTPGGSATYWEGVAKHRRVVFRTSTTHATYDDALDAAESALVWMWLHVGPDGVVHHVRPGRSQPGFVEVRTTA